jgi:hypothetical protein
MLPVQLDGFEHVVPGAHFSQLEVPPPAQLPSVPHVVDACATHVPLGSAPPALTVEQVPLLALVREFAHAMHWLLWQVVLLQQKPSMQALFWHSWLPPQAMPTVFLGWQAPPEPVQ